MDERVEAGSPGRFGRLWSDSRAVVGRSLLGIAIVVVLLPLGIANMYARATWNEVEDGVLWVAKPEGVVAAELVPRGAGFAAGIRTGDVLLAINNQAIDRPGDVVAFLHLSKEGTALRYTLARQGREPQLVTVELAPVPQGNRALYFVLASVGVFALLVGAAVRMRRRSAPVTLHFLWLSVAFFGTLAFSFSGRLDRLDWIFYWADAIAVLVLPPLFLHFTLVFPERPRAWAGSPAGSRLLPLFYLPALLLGAAHVFAVTRAPLEPRFYVAILGVLDRVELPYLSLYLVGGLLVLVRALRHVQSLTARRQLRWMVWGTGLGVGPFAVGYALPFAAGVDPTLPMELTAIPLGLIPLAFGCAIVRYRLMDVEVIIKRALVWSAAVAAITAIYAVLLRVAGAVFLEDSHRLNSVIAMLATLVVVLLARPVKDAIQATFDRAFYRDRYDYRRALVGFARDLNTDLDLSRLSERLIARVTETLLVDRMALMLVDERTRDFGAFRTAGLPEGVPRLARGSGFAARLLAGQPLALDDPLTTHRLDRDEVEAWREHELYYFIPCVSKDGTIAVLALGRKRNGEPLTSEDTALLAAVAGQVATALENGRLYRQLHLKAEEFDRLREFSESIIESLDAGLLVVDVAARVVRWNRALEQLYGLRRQEAIGRSLDEVFDPQFVQALRTAGESGEAGATLSRLTLPTRKSGDDAKVLVNVTKVPLVAPGTSRAVTAGTIIIIEDVTARVQLEEQLQISDKMASIGLLAAGVAHEVNTPLTGISSFTQMLLDGADPQDPRTQLLEKIERQTFRAAKIVNGLLNLSRPVPSAERTHVDLNATVTDVLALLEHQFKVGKIKVRRELASPGPAVFGVEYKLQQVFLNLFLNAHDAMPKGGWLSVTTRGEGDRAMVEVADTGGGIPAEHLPRIYDPFFSTKAIGQGTGLGLSITYGIVREHDGAITCDSEVGVGTRFTLTLPLASAASQRPSRAAN
jgi:two-component system NtrC family sensor kinase